MSRSIQQDGNNISYTAISEIISSFYIISYDWSQGCANMQHLFKGHLEILEQGVLQYFFLISWKQKL